MKTRIEEYNRAGYPVLWVLTSEPGRVVKETCAANKVHWDAVRGLSLDLQHFEECDPLAIITQVASKQECVAFLEN